MDVRFYHLDALHWLWVVLALAAIIVAGFALKRRDLSRFADTALLDRLLASASFGRQYVRAGLLVTALVLLVAALIDPRWGLSYRQVRQRGVDVVVVLDVSRSMLARDAAPDRLTRAKQYISDLVEQMAGDRVALVTFAGTAALKCPLTVDYGMLRLVLSSAGPDTAPRGGSLLGDALRIAADAFTDRIPDHKAIVVFTDGEDQGSYPMEAARALHEELAVPIHTVGIGDAGEGARIPVEENGQTLWLTHDGQEVWSKMDPSLLREMALATSGAFVPVGTGTVDMGRVYAERIEPVAKRELEAATVRRHDPQFQWFVGLALAMLLTRSFIGDRRAAPARGGLREVMT